jgi:subtilase family serine protease
VKLNPTGTNFVYSTYVGGAGWDWPWALAIDAAGAAYVTGETNSSNFPVTAGANDTAISAYYDAFVLKLAPNGRTLAYSTFLGGGRWDNAFGIAVDAAGSAYVTGQTNSTDFPVTPGALRDYMMGGADGFVTKFDPTGATLAYSTFLGGSTFTDRGQAVAVNSLGEAFVTGLTYSVDFPLTQDAFDTRLNLVEGFITQLNASGSGILYSTYIGGSGSDDQGSSIALDALGVAYITGWTNSSDFPTTPDAFDRTLAGQGDAIIVKLLPATARDPADLALAPADIAFSPPPPARLGMPVAVTATVHNLGGTNATNVLVRFYDGPPAGANQIGGDQVLPFVERFFGSGNASVTWTAGPLGTHDLWVVVDPANAIPEKREDNNAASARIDVLPLEPDLAVTASDLSLSPPPPYVVGTSVLITATVRNVGDAPSAATLARFTAEPIPPPMTIGDRPLPGIPAGGNAVVSIPWTAPQSWTWTLCVIADPGGLVAEMDEGNNAACVAARVLLPPDLRPTALSVDPAPPLPYGTAALAYATVVNWGEEAAGPFDVLLFDDENGNRAPDAGEALGRTSLAGLAAWDRATVAVGWTAAIAGARSVCAYADPPPGAVSETSESNNVLCTSVEVGEPPPTLAQYRPLLPQPPGTIRVGLRAPVTFSVQVRNDGNATGEAATTVAFANATTPALPFATFVLPPLAPGADSARFVATWVSPATPGMYAIVAAVDPGHLVVEWDEADNEHAWTVEVLGGPMTALVVGVPNATAEGTTYATSATPLSLDARDQSGTGIRQTTYRVDNGSWEDYAATGPFTLAGEGDRFVEWYSEDNANNTEAVAWRVLRVDDTPPTTTLSIGDPKHVAAETFVTSATPLTLAAVDGGATPVGLGGTEYRIGTGPWIPYAGPFSLSGEGAHVVEYRTTDLLGNAEAPVAAALVADDSPPAIEVLPGTPRHQGDATYVASATLFTITVTDEGAVPVGLASVEHRVGGPWLLYTIPFALIGPDGERTVEARAADLLGHVALLAITVVLDDTPPTTTASRGEGAYPTGTTFELAAEDGGSGVAATTYSVDGGPWEAHGAPIALLEGAHAIRYYSTDRLNNTEPERTLAVTIEGAPLPPAREPNWKPLVAAIFAAVLAVVGVGSARRAPSRVGSRPRLRAFALTALPFVALEAGTGVASLLTGLLTIPPLLGVGTAVDVAILVVGVAVPIQRARRRRSPG